jgi:cytochrome c oxidase assembly protein subunit 15
VIRDSQLATDAAKDRMAISTGHRRLLLITAVMTYLLVTMGGVVCFADASRGCPDWPACHGQLIPPLRIDSVLEYTHRLLAALTSVLIVVAAIVGWRKTGAIRWVSWPPTIAIGFLLAVTVFGALVVLRGLSPGLAAVDLASALTVLALIVAASVVASVRYRNSGLPDRLAWGSPYARLALWALASVFAVLVSGVLVANGAPVVRCLGWPLLGGQAAAAVQDGWPVLARRLLAGAAGVLIVASVVQAWRTQRGQPAVLRAATGVGLLFLVEAALGILLVVWGPNLVLLSAYAAAAAGLWAVLVVLVVLTGLV